MSKPDTFIDEVTEELRRDRLMGLARRWAPLGIAVVILGIGAIAYSEWREARLRAAAEARGTAVFEALAVEDPEARQVALAALEPGLARGPIGLMEAANRIEADDQAGAVAIAEGLARDAIGPVYRDAALLKALLADRRSPEARIVAATPLTEVGRPFRWLALEARGLAHLEAGDREAALADFRRIVESADPAQEHRDRVSSYLRALGEPVSATLLETR